MSTEDSEHNQHFNDCTKVALNEYFQILSNFENIKQKLQEKRETILSYLFYRFGYTFSTKLTEPNFYHFAAESWFLTILNQLKVIIREEITEKKIKNQECTEFTFNDLLTKIFSIVLNESLFIENLEIILGTYQIAEDVVKITQIKLGQIFIEKICKSKEDTLAKPIPANINRRNFEDVLFLVLKKAVNYTLNCLDSKQNNKDSLLLLNIFTEMKKRNKENHFLNVFIDEVNKQKEEENKEEHDESERENRIEILNPSSAFYYFAISSLGEVLEDIEIFNMNSDGIITKLRVLITRSYSKVRSLAQIPLSLYSNLRVNFSLTEYFNNPRIQNVVVYLNNASEFVTKTKKFNLSKSNRSETMGFFFNHRSRSSFSSFCL